MTQSTSHMIEPSSLTRYAAAVPKVELHVHLEGSILPETLLILAKRNGIALPSDTAEGLRKWFAFTDFNHFIQVYITITRCLQRRDDYELIAYELGREMARQNVRYAEVTFSPGTHQWLGVPQNVYFTGITKGRERAQKDFGVEIGWVFDLVRNATNPEKVNDYVTSVAIEGKADGVIALGLGGKEEGFPPEPFAPWFEKARGAGLHSTPHAGEMMGPESVWGAVKSLAAERIGHGVRAIEDPKLVEHLASNKIPLEVSPTSNVRLGVFQDYASHPLRRLREAGVVVTINSDDPPLFGTTLTREIELLGSAFKYGLNEIDDILLAGLECSFLPDTEKLGMKQRFLKEMGELKEGL